MQPHGDNFFPAPARQVPRLPEAPPFVPSISWLGRAEPDSSYSHVLMAMARATGRRSIDGMGNYVAEGAGKEEEVVHDMTEHLKVMGI
eukprot:755009-Hanusia_phi.AAC.6